MERMTDIFERIRIVRDIHNNAGHEIVAAFIAFQTIQNILDLGNAEILELYEDALKRLGNGAGRIQEMSLVLCED